MRRLGLILSVAVLATLLVSIATLTAAAQTKTPESAPNDSQTGADFISQGSVADADSAVVRAARADVAEEERLPDYSQVVDNKTASGRFSAPGWKSRDGGQGSREGQVSYGDDYVYARSGSDVKPARFRVRIPTSNDYTVYAWWPALSGNSAAARFGIGAASGTRWTAVDQTTDGGIWIKLGTYAMKKGERFVWISADSSGEGNVVADAVAVVRGDVTAPPDEQAGGGTASRSGEATYSASSISNPTRGKIVRVARRYLGTRYKWGTCTTYRMSCTCETKKTFAHFGHWLPMSEWGQWKGRKGSWRVGRSDLRRGDEVFFKENGPNGGITHVAVYSGNGNIVHASSYYGKVVESKMKYIRGYHGAKRYRLHG